MCVIRSNRRARGTGGGVESIKASALHSSPSLLFCRVEKNPVVLHSARQFELVLKASSVAYVTALMPLTQYLSVSLPGRGMWQAGGGMSRTGW